MLTQYDKNRRIIMLIGDYIAIVASFHLAFLVRYSIFVPEDKRPYALFFSAPLYVVIFYILDFYDLSYRVKGTAYLARIILTVLTASAVVSIVYYLIPVLKFGRGIFLINAIVSLITISLWRLAFIKVFGGADRPKRIVVVGFGNAGRVIHNTLAKHPHQFQIVGILHDYPGNDDEGVRCSEAIGESASLGSLAESGRIDAAVISNEHDKSPDLLKAMIHAKMKGVELFDMPTLYEYLTGKLPVIHLGDAWMAETTFKGISRTVYMMHVKRMFDIFLSAVGLVLASPIMLLTAICIKLESRGPILYRQRRVGFNEKVFELFKFRSMQVDAETGCAVWACTNDPRVTRVGSFVRKTRIDEIPQMWNVLRGDMSFIGPRPERPEFVSVLQEEIPFYSFRHTVQPGITGWAQVNYRYGASKEDALEKLQYDLYYIKNLSFTLDIHVLLKTIRVVLFGKGAR